MPNSNSQHSTHKLYQNVIDSVIRNLAATFLDCGIDDSIREELRTNWMANLEAMGAVTDYIPTPGAATTPSINDFPVEPNFLLPQNPATLIPILLQKREGDANDRTCYTINVPAGAIKMGIIEGIVNDAEIQKIIQTPPDLPAPVLEALLQEKFDTELAKVGFAVSSPKAKIPRARRSVGKGRGRRGRGGGRGRGRGRGGGATSRSRTAVEEDPSDMELGSEAETEPSAPVPAASGRGKGPSRAKGRGGSRAAVEVDPSDLELGSGTEPEPAVPVTAASGKGKGRSRAKGRSGSRAAVEVDPSDLELGLASEPEPAVDASVAPVASTSGKSQGRSRGKGLRGSKADVETGPFLAAEWMDWDSPPPQRRTRSSAAKEGKNLEVGVLPEPAPPTSVKAKKAIKMEIPQGDGGLGDDSEIDGGGDENGEMPCTSASLLDFMQKVKAEKDTIPEIDMSDDEEEREMLEFAEEYNASSSQGPDMLYNQDNVIVCQYEKVIRKRYQWKFVLKDGIMRVNGKDYVFGRGKGESISVERPRNEVVPYVPK